MEWYLDKSDLQKVRILRYLFNQKYFLSALNIAEEINVSERTTIKLITEIGSDLEEASVQARIVEGENKTFQLEMGSKCSIKVIEYFYLKRSFTYQVCEAIFYDRFKDTASFAKIHYTSVTSAYRKINKMKPILDKFELYSTYSMSRFNGAEKQIRYYFYLFYYNSCWGETWPFELIEREKVLGIFENTDIELPDYILYWIAVCLTRAKLGFKIDDNVERDEEIFKRQHYLFDFFTKKMYALYKECTSLSDESIANEVSFAFTIFSCFEKYDLHDPKIIYMMNFIENHRQHILVRASVFWMEQYLKYVPIEVTTEEYNMMIANLLHVHFYAITFKGPSMLFQEDPYLTRLKSSASYKIEILNRFYDRLLEKKEFAEVFKNREMLIGRYHDLILDLFYHNDTVPLVKIQFLSVFSNKADHYFRRLQSIYPEVALCKKGEKADLIITDRLYVGLEEEDIFIWSTVPTNDDFISLKEHIDQLNYKKYYQSILQNI